MKQITLVIMILLSISCSTKIEYIEVPVNAHSKIESVSITTKTDNLFVGEALVLQYRLLPICTADKPIEFVSSDEKIATVDNTGKVMAKSPGTVVISIQSVSDKPANSSIELLIKDQSKGLYAIGDYFPDPNDPNTAIGIVYHINETDESFLIHNGVGFSKRGEIISIDEKQDTQFSLINEYILTATSASDGEANTRVLSSLENYSTNYPPIKWVMDKNSKTSIVRWYLPVSSELSHIQDIIYGPKYYDLKIYDKFEPAKGQPINLVVLYISSSVSGGSVDIVCSVRFSNGGQFPYKKSHKYHVKAIAKF